METICGVDCSECGFKENCGGCKATNGHPFGEPCMIAQCCNNNGNDECNKFCLLSCKLKAQLIKEFNALGIEDMEEVKNLNALKGSFINLEYTLANGQIIKFWDDNKIFLGDQICKRNSNRCYGLTADENYLLVCEYENNGENPEIVIFKRRQKRKTDEYYKT